MSDKIKTLSQAIRLGATFHPQGFYKIRNIDKNEQTTATCVIGAAAEVCGLDLSNNTTSYHFARLQERFNLPWELSRMLLCWNDYDKISREEIADKLEKMGY